MSALCHFQTHAPAANCPLLNHLIGFGKQRWWHGETERLGGLEIDHQFKFGRLQARQVGGPLAFENPAGVDSGLTICIGDAGTIAHQYSGGGMLSPGRNRGYRVAEAVDA
jgi:hypothetical protein